MENVNDNFTNLKKNKKKYKKRLKRFFVFVKSSINYQFKSRFINKNQNTLNKPKLNEMKIIV